MAFFPQGFTACYMPGTVGGTKDTIGNQNTMSRLSLGLETSVTALQGQMAVRKAEYPPADSLPAGSGSSCTALGTWGTSSWHTGESLPGLPSTSSRKPVRALDASWYRLPSANSKSGAAVGPSDIPPDGNSLRAGLLHASMGCSHSCQSFLVALCLSWGSDSASPPLRSLPCCSLHLVPMLPQVPDHLLWVSSSEPH